MGVSECPGVTAGAANQKEVSDWEKALIENSNETIINKINAFAHFPVKIIC
ncbi:MAG: hypothetical protein NVSMB63_01400 [Sediminibacterium sp.]